MKSFEKVIVFVAAALALIANAFSWIIIFGLISLFTGNPLWLLCWLFLEIISIWAVKIVKNKEK